MMTPSLRSALGRLTAARQRVRTLEQEAEKNRRAGNAPAIAYVPHGALYELLEAAEDLQAALESGHP